ncbi:MAG: DNA mismatch repair protein MutS [Flavobacteriia bacterium]|nr:DNA mismatch repair protein MutS [Flavobacteriia bacterium]
MASASKETPLMRQYYALKAEYPEALLLFRVGDFYETFGEDAIKASKALEITLTKRSNGAAADMELAGFPHHSLDTYLPRLVKAGYKVAVCEQLEDPKTVKGIVKRGVTEVVTPGIAHQDSLLPSKSNNYLACFHEGGGEVGLAFLDVSTGEFWVAQSLPAEAVKWMTTFHPSEVVYNRRHRTELGQQLLGSRTPSSLEDWVFQSEYAQEAVQTQFGSQSIKGFGLEDAPLAVVAAGALLHYLRQSQYTATQHILTVQRLRPATHLWMDKFTLRNLELFSTAHGGGMTLLDVLDHTASPMGGRWMRRWLALPLVEEAAILERQNAVAAGLAESEQREHLRALLGQLGDMERMATRLATGRIGPRELQRLAQSLEAVEALGAELNGEGAWMPYLERLDPMASWREATLAALADELPAVASKGGLFRPGYHAELDRYKNLKRDANQVLEAILARETEATGIQGLKVAFNSVFGYYLEVRNTQKERVPAEWIRKQTLVNAERYITEELKTLETEILEADEKVHALEQRLYLELVTTSQAHVHTLLATARSMAAVDVLLTLAHLAQRHRWCRPTFSTGLDWAVIQGRHPVIEQRLRDAMPYIPNDVHLSANEEQMWIITGPNMSGKSALLRQTALHAIMAQMGGYVPAQSAQLPLLDRLFVRVGASDNLSEGESTFMVEMAETASILHGLTERSLVLLDEIGRGTATYDGLSIAQSIAEYLHQHPFRPLTLFATHYHELNALEAHWPRIANRHVSILEEAGQMVFLRTLAPGGSNHSFGIHVARMAGMPKPVVLRAQEVLTELEALHGESPEGSSSEASQNGGAMQLSFIQWEEPETQAWKSELAQIDPNALTPMEALLLLQRWKERFGKG